MPEVHEIKFLADEGFSAPLTSILKEMGYDIKWVGDFASGVDDIEVFKISREEGRIILTEDKDFGELAIRFRHRASGILLLRIDADQKELRQKRIIELFRNYSDKLKGHLVIIDTERFRFRKLP